MLEVIQERELGVITVLILNKIPKSSGQKSGIVYRTFSVLDRKLFKVSENAFKRKNIKSLNWLSAAEIEVFPIQKKYSDFFSGEDLKKIKENSPDVLFRLGFRILKGEILSLAPLGIWSYHHGDNLVNRGGPPCFWEVMLGWEQTGSVLQILSDKLDDGLVIYRSWSRTDPLSVYRNANKVYWKSLFFIPRNLERIKRIGVDSWKLECFQWDKSDSIKSEQLFSTPSNFRMISLAGTWILRNSLRKIKEIKNREVWTIWIAKSMSALRSGQGVEIRNPEGAYLADPNVFEFDGKTYCFAEEFEYKIEKGHIVGGEISSAGLFNLIPVIKEPFHLSYPFVFSVEEANYMYAESAASKSLRLYRSIEFPYSWELANSSMEGESLYDPTVCYRTGLFWLFANKKEHPGASSFDELFLYYTEDVLKPDWKAHPDNPIVSDVKSSRPAGRLFEKDGVWFRPAQDSAKHYGHKIKIQRILKWDLEDYKEETYEVIEADWNSELKGTHTISITKDWLAIDSFQR
jgi:hypothetical protein